MKVSFEKALKEEGNIFELTKLVIHRARKISYDDSVALSGSAKYHKPAVIALMELEEGTISLDAIKEDIKSQIAIQDSIDEIENIENTQGVSDQNLDEILPVGEEIIISAKTEDSSESKEKQETKSEETEENEPSAEDELEKEVIEEIHSHD